GCGAPTERIQAVAENPVQASVGDVVTVEGSSKQILGMAAVVYTMPLILFFVFYGVCAALHMTEGISILAGVAGFAICILIAIRRNHQMKKSGEIVFKIVKRG
ncbi:MAG: SoxR reducing system RseC family protein, partial [Butyricicoccus pullicaecorum]|nr:SoxR reducing system RseC family protein [Butyricicoccus pullicaecorum]